MNLDDQRPVFLIHYTAALATCASGLVLTHAWLAGFGAAMMLTWVIRARKVV